MGRFDDKTVIITGGAGGIGSAVAAGFAREGARVAVADIDARAAELVASRLNGLDAGASHIDASHIGLGIDIADTESVRAGLSKIESALGPIDIVVNNAGWDLFAPFVTTSPQDWTRLIDINLVGALNMHHAALGPMIERGYGRFVNISSDAARVGSTGEAVYAACKAGLIALSKTLAREHSRDGITFNVVCPGPTDTALLAAVTETSANPEKLREAFRRAIPMGRLGEPNDLVGAVLFFAGDEAAFVTGQVLSVSGGLTMAG